MSKSKKLLIAANHAESPYHFIQQSWYGPLKKIFKHISCFDPQKYLLYEGREELNRKFLQVLKKEQPDYIFFYIIDIRLQSIKVIQQILHSPLKWAS